MRFRLGLMMFLQYCIWGVWAPILVLHLLGLEDFVDNPQTKINRVYMTMAIASIIAPFIAGQIADRYFPTQHFLGLSHLAGGVLLIVVAGLKSYPGIFVVMLAYSIIYAPTVALTNAICFRHLPDAKKDFSRVRLWGTIGWIVIMWLFSVWIGGADPLLAKIAPGAQESLASWRRGLPHQPGVVDCLYVAAGLSFVLGVYSFFLPHTPPPEKPQNPLAFVEALQLMRKRSFAVLVVIAFLVSTELQFYFVLTPSFFNQGGGPFGPDAIAKVIAKDPDSQEALAAARAHAERMIDAADTTGDAKLNLGELGTLAESDPAAATFLESQQTERDAKGGLALDDAYVGPVMTFGQICEVIVLAFLPVVLRYWGFRLTIGLGIAAWALRYFIFALGHPTGLVIASQTLHGFGFGFFFVAIYIYADAIAPKDIQASVQSLLVLTTMGVGMFVSSLIAGPIADALKSDWHQVFLVPAVLCAVCCVAFLIGFRSEPKQPAPAAESA
jgi:MFS family permease